MEKFLIVILEASNFNSVRFAELKRRMEEIGDCLLDEVYV